MYSPSMPGYDLWPASEAPRRWPPCRPLWTRWKTSPVDWQSRHRATRAPKCMKHISSGCSSPRTYISSPVRMTILIRMSKTWHQFAKGYKGHWSKEIIHVEAVQDTSSMTYVVTNAAIEPIKGTFYGLELQKVTPPDYFDIEAILDTHRCGKTTRWWILHVLLTAHWFSHFPAMPARRCTPKTLSWTSGWSCQRVFCCTAMTKKLPWPASLICAHGTTCHGHGQPHTATFAFQQGHIHRNENGDGNIANAGNDVGGGRVMRRWRWGASWSASPPGHPIHQEPTDA